MMAAWKTVMASLRSRCSCVRSSPGHQMRSRSPVTCPENYALKIAAGYVLHASHENDSYYFYYFLLRLKMPS